MRMGQGVRTGLGYGGITMSYRHNFLVHRQDDISQSYEFSLKMGLPLLNPIALKKAKIVYNFGLSECNKVKQSQKSRSTLLGLFSKETNPSYNRRIRVVALI